MLLEAGETELRGPRWLGSLPSSVPNSSSGGTIKLVTNLSPSGSGRSEETAAGATGG